VYRNKLLILLLIVLAVALLFIRKTPTSGRPEGQLWFYNEITGQLFAASDFKHPPRGEKHVGQDLPYDVRKFAIGNLQLDPRRDEE
jgi:hypothetical protein